MAVLFNLFLNYILMIFQVVELIGGQNDMFVPPPPPHPPRIDASGYSLKAYIPRNLGKVLKALFDNVST